MQAENQPLPEEIEKAMPLDSSQRLRLGSGAAILKFLKNNILKPRQPTEIHSGSIVDAEKNKTLAPFAMSGVEVGRVNRDYEAFFKASAWGRDSHATKPSTAGEFSASSSTVSSMAGNHPVTIAIQSERSELPSSGRPTKPSLPLPAGKPRSRTSGDVLEDQREERPKVPNLHSPQLPRSHGIGGGPAKRTPMLPPSGGGQLRSAAEVGVVHYVVVHCERCNSFTIYTVLVWRLLVQCP